MIDARDLREARARVSAAKHVLVLTGAGISAPSGLATYRSAGSGWDDPDRERKSHASRYGNHLPELWTHWDAVRRQALAAGPNPAHLALADWAARLEADGGSMLIVTQNVDGLHQAAGSTRVVEMHGTLHQGLCMRCRKAFPFDDERFVAPGAPPICPRCGTDRTRPDIVLFGEALPRTASRHVETAMAQSDLVLVVGTSGEVYPVAQIPRAARERGILTTLVDLKPWDDGFGVFDAMLLGDAAEVLPALLSPEPPRRWR